MKSVLDTLKSEPALVAGFVSAVLALLVTFGLKLSVDQSGAVLAVVAAAQALFTRTQVTPTSKPSE